jgi:hypothetical protein
MKSVHEHIDYLDPRLPPGLARVPMPVVDATPTSLEGYGCLADDPAQRRIEIVRWPSIGDKQGAVHARVSVDFPREFGCLLEAPISR